MKPLPFVAAVVLSLATVACNKPVAENTPAEPAEATPTPVAKATPTPTPAASKPVAATAVATPAATPEMAPPGVYYMLVSTRIETADGVIGLTPGTGMKLVRPGVYQTVQGEVQLRDDQVTNNMTLARQVKQQFDSGQAAIKTKIAQEQAAALAHQNAAQANNSNATTVNTSAEPAATPRPVGSSLDQQQPSPTSPVFFDNHGKPYRKDANGGRHYL